MDHINEDMDVENLNPAAPVRPMRPASLPKLRPPAPFKDGSDITLFFRKLEQYLNLAQIPRDQWIGFLVCNLDEKVYSIYDWLPIQDPLDYLLVKNSLIERFQSKGGPVLKLLEFKSRKQGPTESLANFLEALTALAKEAGLGPNFHDRLLEQFSENLSNPATRQVIIRTRLKAQTQHLDAEETLNLLMAKLRSWKLLNF